MLIRPLLSLFIKDVIQDSARNIMKREAVSQVAESARVEFLRAVTEAYTREVTHNISQYVRSVGAVTVEISSDNQGEKLFSALQSSLRALEIELEQQGPDSPVIRYLRRRYAEDRSVMYTGRETKPVYTMVSGYRDTPDPDQPWLNRIARSDTQIGDILANEAARLFGELFPPSKISSPF